MHLEAAPVPARPMSSATWIAVGALVLVLGALSLFLMGCDRVFGLDRKTCPTGEVLVGEVCEKRNPNHYACQCDCKGFGVDARVEAAQTSNVRQDPAGTVLGSAPSGAQGTIREGPVQKVLNGVDETWWRVDFDTLNLPANDGWVVQGRLTVVTGVSVLNKEVDVCLPAEYNENIGGQLPEDTRVVKLNEDCSVRVKDHLATITGQLPPQTQCTCARQTDAETWDASCDAPCLTGVCPVAETASAESPLAPSSARVLATTLAVSSTTPLGLLAPTTLCQVEGVATITVGGHQPKTQPSVIGFVQIHGKPCPDEPVSGQSCKVGVSYQLQAGDIVFESGSIFVDDPKFVGLNLSGASVPGAVDLGFTDLGFAKFYLGGLQPGAALTSAEGRRSGATEQTVSVFRNTQPIALGVNWKTGACRLSGPLGGAIEGDGSEGILNVAVDVELNGVIRNQPPRANAGADQTLQCTSPQGAPVTLDACGASGPCRTTDPDDNIAFYAWRRGAADGPHVADPSFAPTLTTQQPFGDATYHLRVVDTLFAADNTSVKVKVVDTTASDISCNAPATISPPKSPITFKATTTCGAPGAVVIERFECFVVKAGARVKDTTSCKVKIQGDTLSIANTGGTNTIVQWIARATDSGGTVGRKACEVFVGNPGGQ